MLEKLLQMESSAGSVGYSLTACILYKYVVMRLRLYDHTSKSQIAVISC